MSQLEELRLSILSEANPLGSKRRFGLFSQPISTAVGDDGAFRNKIHPRNEMGKPLTEPRNIFVSPLKAGKGRSSYFGALNSLADHERRDIFMEEGVRLLKEQHQSFTLGRKETNFYPIAGIKPITNSSYQYIEQKNPELDPKRYKMEDGRVRSGPKNFYTNSQSKVNDSLFRHYKYVEDPFNRQHEKEVEEMRKSRAKEGEAKFMPNSFVPQLLNKHKDIYGLDKQMQKSPPKQPQLNILKHETPWRPASDIQQGLDGFFQPVHPYIQSPPPLRKRRPQANHEQEPFRGMGTSFTTPTPSVTLNRVNMMKSINRSLSPKK